MWRGSTVRFQPKRAWIAIQRAEEQVFIETYGSDFFCGVDSKLTPYVYKRLTRRVEESFQDIRD